MNRKNMLLLREQFLIDIIYLDKFLLTILISIGFWSCTDHPVSPEPEPPVKINLYFQHLIDHQEIDFDTLKYINEAGNPYLVNEIQYFISDIILYHSNGNSKRIEDWTDIHYVDTDLPETWQWAVYDDFEAGKYDSVSFTFGISEDKNISFMYVNPPEKDMFWPEFLGGGYHYMKLNGKWLPEGQTVQTTPFDFHLGIGQEYASYPDSIIGFIHNYFRVSLPNSAFEVESGETKNLNITMHVEKWFKEPHVYDHDTFGGYIMQNQEAMQKVKENGQNVFTFEAN
ncbi:MAG: MbnP family protein [Bacteroidales bacterium]